MAGADVIKVEPVNGERLRGAGGAKTPLSFAMLNSNKKSITLNLQDEAGKMLLRELVKGADVLLENYAPGVMDRLGVGWEALKKLTQDSFTARNWLWAFWPGPRPARHGSHHSGRLRGYECNR